MKSAIREGDGGIGSEGTSRGRLSTAFEHAAVHGDGASEGMTGTRGRSEDDAAITVLRQAASPGRGPGESDVATGRGREIQRPRQGQGAREGLGARVEATQSLRTSCGRIGESVGDRADTTGENLGEGAAGEGHGLRVKRRVMAGDEVTVIDVRSTGKGVRCVEDQRTLLILTQCERPAHDAL